MSARVARTATERVWATIFPRMPIHPQKVLYAKHGRVSERGPPYTTLTGDGGRAWGAAAICRLSSGITEKEKPPPARCQRGPLCV